MKPRTLVFRIIALKYDGDSAVDDDAVILDLEAFRQSLNVTLKEGLDEPSNLI